MKCEEAQARKLALEYLDFREERGFDPTAAQRDALRQMEKDADEIGFGFLPIYDVPGTCQPWKHRKAGR